MTERPGAFKKVIAVQLLPRQRLNTADVLIPHHYRTSVFDE
jgi:hypothetical protein